MWTRDLQAPGHGFYKPATFIPSSHLQLKPHLLQEGCLAAAGALGSGWLHRLQTPLQISPSGKDLQVAPLGVLRDTWRWVRWKTKLEWG